MTRALAIAVALAAAACNCGPQARGPDSPGDDPCAEVADQVRALYRTESTGDGELDAELLDANVHMVLADCETDPDRFVPCIRSAQSVAALESQCVIELDDEGRVEGERFGDSQ